MARYLGIGFQEELDPASGRTPLAWLDFQFRLI